MKIDNKIEWTHWFEPAGIPGFAVKCIILEDRKGLFAKMFGEVRILTECGYVDWERKDYLIKFLNKYPF